MKVAMVVSNYPELSEKFLINQVEGLREAGLELDVYAIHPFHPREAAAQSLRKPSYVHYVGIPKSLGKRVLRFPSDFMQTLFHSPKALLRSFDISSYGTAARALKLLPFYKLFRKQEYDTLHCQFGWNGLIGAYLKDLGLVKRLVVTFHGSDINSYPSRIGASIYHRMYQSADRVISNTAFTNDKVITNGCPAEKTAIVPVGLSVAEYPMVDPGTRAPFTLLTVGRLAEKKGHRYALQALARLQHQFPELEYLIAGDGPLRSALEREAEELGIASRVRFLGACDYDTVRDLYGRATLFTLPSVTASDGDREGQGLVLQEAQARGLPVISTIHNGIPDGVLEGKTGFLVPEGNAEELANRIATLLQDKALYTKMAYAGRDFVASRYDSTIISKRLMELYQ